MLSEIERALARIREFGPARIVSDGKHQSFVPLSCTVAAPVTWDRRRIESELNVQLPDELVALWDQAGELRLFEDTIYGQWGLVIYDPSTARKRHRGVTAGRREDFVAGDLVLGEFRGEADFPVIRCDAGQRDFGSVLVSLPMDPRESWYSAARSLSEFLERFVETSGQRYWEH
jgi:hypothetical protein